MASANAGAEASTVGASPPGAPPRDDDDFDRSLELDAVIERAEAEIVLRVAQLSNVGLFRGLSLAQLRPLAEVAVVLDYQPGEALVRQGDPGESVYIIVDGEVEVLTRSSHDPAAPEAVVAWLVNGDAVGELSLLDGEPRSATCRAVSTTRCLRLGRPEFLQALQTHWALTQELLHVLSHRLRLADRLLAEHARDPLTGLNSRRTLQEVYAREARRAERARQRGEHTRPPLALLFADVNDFKQINDTHGHLVGDGVLRSVANALTAVSRESDFVIRYGGDEFVVLLPESGDEGAKRIAKRIRQSLAEHPPGPVPFSISIGTAVMEPHATVSLDDLVARADHAMYADKARAHAHVRSASPEGAS